MTQNKIDSNKWLLLHSVRSLRTAAQPHTLDPDLAYNRDNDTIDQHNSEHNRNNYNDVDGARVAHCIREILCERVVVVRALRDILEHVAALTTAAVVLQFKEFGVAAVAGETNVLESVDHGIRGHLQVVYGALWVRSACDCVVRYDDG
jgi:hypothetical protein